MNWKTYKNLTQEQKDEYRFKFIDNKPVVDASRVISWVVVMFFIIENLLFTAYLFLVGEHFVQYKDQVMDIIIATLSVANVLLLFAVITMIINAIRVLYYGIQESLWYRRNKIKKKWGWPFKKWGKKSDQTY